MGGWVVAVLYRLVLLLYPRCVRVNHGDEMVATIEFEWRHRADDGLRGIVGFVFWLSQGSFHTVSAMSCQTCDEADHIHSVAHQARQHMSQRRSVLTRSRRGSALC